MIDKESRHRTTISDIIYFYKQQIARFEKIGLGNTTEFNTVITHRLIDVTIKRLHELQTRRDQLIYRARGRDNNGIQ